MQPDRAYSLWRVPPPCGPGWLRYWLRRHQHPICFYLHVVGIPTAAAALPCLWLEMYWSAAGLFFLGYFLQWLGHKVEGNDVGELIPFKRLLGLPVVEFGPRGLACPDTDRRGRNREAASQTGTSLP